MLLKSQQHSATRCCPVRGNNLRHTRTKKPCRSLLLETRTPAAVTPTLLPNLPAWEDLPAGITTPAPKPAPVGFKVSNPGAADKVHFTQHASAQQWYDWTVVFDGLVASEANLRHPVQLADLPRLAGSLLAGRLAAGDVQGAAYWAYHLLKGTFFLVLSTSGVCAHHILHHAQQYLQHDMFGPPAAAATATGGSTSGNTVKTPFEAADAGGNIVDLFCESLAVFSCDLQYIQQGHYKLPWDAAAFPALEQHNPLMLAARAAAVSSEAAAILGKLMSAGPTHNWFTSNMYPDYYAATTFHFQSQGWHSSRSAELYEFTTEALFWGRQDAMQRLTLLPLATHIRDMALDPAQMTLLEVGCGTGRFHTFLKDNYPTMRTIAADLSIFYLEKARDNMLKWQQQRPPRTSLQGMSYMQAPMEELPLPDASLDVVVCVYCFHEMPEAARLAAAKEWFRVLRPGGLVVLTDSEQVGDRRGREAQLGYFSNVNEPYFEDYLACDLGSLFAFAGFKCGTKYLCSVTKTLSFFKPAGGSDSLWQ